jgi:hypothetical protein
VLTGLLLLTAVLCAFWSVSVYATHVGDDFARSIERSTSQRPKVTIYSEDDLSLAPPVSAVAIQGTRYLRTTVTGLRPDVSNWRPRRRGESGCFGEFLPPGLGIVVGLIPHDAGHGDSTQRVGGAPVVEPNGLQLEQLLNASAATTAAARLAVRTGEVLDAARVVTARRVGGSRFRGARKRFGFCAPRGRTNEMLGSGFCDGDQRCALEIYRAAQKM